MAFDQASQNTTPWGPKQTPFNGRSKLFMTLDVVIFHLIDTRLQNLSSLSTDASQTIMFYSTSIAIFVLQICI